MIDGHNTSLEWQTHTGRICVGAVGAFEQHSVHLPLETDNIEGDYFARHIAGELDAALLPTLRFGTSLEQSGFRGTLTLRPDTLMRVVRDLADELERQGFTRWVLINAHGGNFALNPAVREINRADRPLKILLVNFWEFDDPPAAAAGRPSGPDIHSGAWETSLMLALAPELVRPGAVDMPPVEGVPFRQSDLVTFGVGYWAPAGALGRPSAATRDQGERSVEAIRRNMLVYVRDRLRRLDDQPRYAGSGGIALRAMTEADIPDGMRLKEACGWNQVESHWRFFIEHEPAGCFVAVHNGRVAGTVTAVNYDNRVAWIGMVLVDPALRRMGIATRLMERALGALQGCRCVKLDATPVGKAVYDRLGFLDESRLWRRAGTVPPGSASVAAGVVPIEVGRLQEAIEKDARVFGVSRPVVLSHLRHAAPELAWCLMGREGPRAFCLGRPGSRFHQIGPVCADTEEDARAVVQAAFTALVGRPVVLDVPAAQGPFGEWLTSLGIVEQRPFVRMARRASEWPGEPGRYFAIAGPEFG